MNHPQSINNHIIGITPSFTEDIKIENSGIEKLVFFNNRIQMDRFQRDHNITHSYTNLLAIRTTDAVVYSSQLKITPYWDFMVELDQNTKPTLEAQDVDDIIDFQYNLLNVSTLNNIGGVGVKIGIIDEGVDTTHPSLSHMTIYQEDFHGSYFPGARDHGTKVAGMIGGIWQNKLLGYAPNATLYSAAVGNKFPGESGTLAGDIYGAFDYMIEQDVDIVNTSFGGPTDVWIPLVEQLQDHGILLIGSAGNLKPNEGEVRDYHISGPGSVGLAIGVGAIEQDLTPSIYSYKGPNIHLQDKPDLVSFGSPISCIKDGTIEQISGTSFSTPHIVGATALLLQLIQSNITKNNQPGVLKSLLLSSAHPLNYPLNKVGKGIPDISKAYSLFLAGNQSFHLLTNTSNPLYLENIHHAGSHQVVEFAYVTTSNFTSAISGNLSSFSWLTHENHTQGYIILQINSSIAIPFGNYVAYISILSGGKNTTFGFEISITTKFMGNIAVDLYHTNLDELQQAGKYGFSSYFAYRRIWMLGYYLMDYNTLENYSLLNTDIIWVSNLFPYGMIHDYYGETSSIQLDSMYLQNIQDYLTRGGNIIFSLFPVAQSQNELSTDPESIDPLLSLYGLSLGNHIPVDAFNTLSQFEGTNTTSFLGNQSLITTPYEIQIGNDVVNTYSPYRKEKSGPIIMTESPNGKILWISSETWLSACRYPTNAFSVFPHSSHCTPDDIFLNPISIPILNDSLRWFAEPSHLSISTPNFNGTHVTIEISSASNDSITSEVHISGSVHPFDYSSIAIESSGEDELTFFISQSGVFYRSNYTLDTLSPRIWNFSLNNSIVKRGQTISFLIQEKFYDEDDIALYVDDIEHTINTVRFNTYYENSTHDSFYIIIPTWISLGYHKFTLQVTDKFGHKTLLNQGVIVSNPSQSSSPPQVTSFSNISSDTETVTSNPLGNPTLVEHTDINYWQPAGLILIVACITFVKYRHQGSK